MIHNWVSRLSALYYYLGCTDKAIHSLYLCCEKLSDRKMLFDPSTRAWKHKGPKVQTQLGTGMDGQRHTAPFYLLPNCPGPQLVPIIISGGRKLWGLVWCAAFDMHFSRPWQRESPSSYYSKPGYDHFFKARFTNYSPRASMQHDDGSAGFGKIYERAMPQLELSSQRRYDLTDGEREWSREGAVATFRRRLLASNT